MNQETSLRELLQNKFNELPVRGDAAGDWKKLKKILRLTMPVGLLAIGLLHLKALMAKKAVWVSLLAVGGGATALVVYNKWNAKGSQIVIPSKTGPDLLVQPKPDSNILNHDTVKNKVAYDTIKPELLNPLLSDSLSSTVPPRKHKTAPPVKVDTTVRIRKQKTVPPVINDSPVRKHKKPPLQQI